MKKLLLVTLLLAGCGPGGSSIELPPEATCSATLTWQAPNDRIDGTPITIEELDKFTIYINRRNSTDPSTVVLIVDLTDTTQQMAEITDIPKGQRYFYMTVTDLNGVESPFSNILSKLCT